MRLAFSVAAFCSLASAQDPREIVRRSVQLMDHNLAVARNYTFLERAETRELDSDAHVKSHKIQLFDVTMLEGSPYRRLVGKDDHPLTPDEERIEQKKLEDSIAQRQNETPAERGRRISEWEKKQRRQREPLDEVPDAFNFKITGEGQVDGRNAWIIEGTPRPGYQPRSTLARLFPKFHGTLWIDKADYQWVKTEAEVTGNISWGLFLARLDKGARLNIEMTRVNAEVWLPRHIAANVSARLALVKKYRIESDTTYSNYRKFQVDSRVVSAAPKP